MLYLLSPQQKACDCRDIRGSSGEASKEGDGSGSSGEVRAEVQGTVVSQRTIWVVRRVPGSKEAGLMKQVL